MSPFHCIRENGLVILIETTADGDVRLLHLGQEPDDHPELWDEKRRSKCRLVEVHFSGENHDDHHGSKHTGTMPGKRLSFERLEETRNEKGKLIAVHQKDFVTEVRVTSYLQLYDGIPVIRSWTEILNEGAGTAGMEYVSSFALTGIDRGGLKHRNQKLMLHIPHNTWYGEAQWRAYRLSELGLHDVNEFSMKRLSYSSTGTWSSSQYVPMAFLENTETGRGLVWQIEHNGSWQWELSDMSNMLYMQASGPSEDEHHWFQNLHPGKRFRSVPVSVGVVDGSLQAAIAAMTQYRRMIRRPSEDNENLPVIFNDYMNCLFGEPTTEALMPLIDAAAETGCEYYCIDCGWYSDGYWWDGVGEWKPSERRFPGGLKEVIDYIRDKGMVPGLWLEIEVMGVNSPLANKVPDDWFFMRHGKRVIDHSRYQLDFRNPEVISHANEVVDRLVREYGVGYIKMDYNINAGIGTETAADSFGDGLLQHNLAYLNWLDDVFERFPQLVIENCGSGGMRMDYALLSRHSIQSTSDQTDYRKNAAIAAASASVVTPEQAAVWSYPLRAGDKEEVIMNMVNSMLLRIHQSGHLAEISEDRLALVKEGIQCYKEIRVHIKAGLPIWPLGMPALDDEWLSYGIHDGDTIYLAVWRMGSADREKSISMPNWLGLGMNVQQLYPAEADCQYIWNRANGSLSVSLPARYSARIFELKSRQLV
ncbi:glycoside hydrolase family 36 protein [Paenibacillus sp. YIM B09110]|uniref:glycoside hydrolase family 36 protein n=1 Tax=Paenibacillus sp. YIM B09110 TaxID=3126102 RepID=UPI00301BE2BE